MKDCLSEIKIEREGNKINRVFIIFNEYPVYACTYLAKTTKGTSKYHKINGQAIYNGKIATYNRNEVMQFLHRYYVENIKINRDDIMSLLPLNIKMYWLTIPNHEAIRMIKGEIRIPKSRDTYEPSFDADNQFPYYKAFQDTLVRELKLIPNDTVKYIPVTGGIEYIPIDDWNKRQIIFELTQHNQEKSDLWFKYFNFKYDNR